MKWVVEMPKLPFYTDAPYAAISNGNKAIASIFY